MGRLEASERESLRGLAPERLTNTTPASALVYAGVFIWL